MDFSWLKGKKNSTEDGAKKRARPTAHAVKGVSLSRLLGEDLIVLATDKIQKKEELIESLVRMLCQRRALGDPATFLKKVLEREQGISTTLDTGLAVPHARMDNLTAISAIFALVPEGLTDPKQPDLPIRAVLLFFSPNRPDAFTQHLHLLRGVSSLFQPEFIDRLKSAGSEAEVLKLIAEKESVV